MPSDDGFSNLLWVWGQFLDHDLVPDQQRLGFGTAPITVPTDDPVFTPGSTLSFNRSEPSSPAPEPRPRTRGSTTTT